MKAILRALIISAVATGGAAVLWHLLQSEAASSSPGARLEPDADAERMTAEQRALLLRELDAHL